MKEIVLSCPKCGKGNACQNDSVREFSCWCQDIDVPLEKKEMIKALGFSADCLCQKCLEDLCKETP